MAPHGNDVFPKLLSSTRLDTDQTLFDVQFWPYGTGDDDQIFAVNGAAAIIICKPRLGAYPTYFEVLRSIRDVVDQNGTSASLNSLAWAENPITREPWICVAGDVQLHIKILDIASGLVVRTLSGHGAAINDLCISPISTSLLASGSNDSTIRLWNLEPDYEEQPCVALFAGEGHKAPVLAIKFHPDGKWLLSGGIDTAVCLWAVPDADALKERGHGKAAKPLVVYYPHFFTKELHPNYVDCFAWFGDLILSKAARDQIDQFKGRYSNEILLWKIEGFDADTPPTGDAPVPEAGYTTRSSFVHDDGLRGFARVLTFDIPHNDRFYHRFGLLHEQGMRPILCMGDQRSRYSFWDMQRLIEGTDHAEPAAMKPKKKAARKKGVAVVLEELRRDESATSGSSRQTPDNSSADASPAPAPTGREFTLSDRLTPLEPHYQMNARDRDGNVFATSQIAWSSDGTWMVSVGDRGKICMFHRDGSML